MNQLDYGVNPAPRRRLRRWLYVATGSCLLLFVYFLFCCSGLNFPILFPRPDLQSLLRGDYRVQLPASAVVERGNRQAYWDPAKYFSIRMAPADVAPFIAKLRANRGAEDHDISQLYSILTPPKWWKPKALSSPRWLETTAKNGTGYWIFYSDKDGRVLIFWYST